MTVFSIRAEALDWVEAGDEIIALDRRSAEYVSTNASAALLWRLLASGATRGALVGELTKSFAIDEERAAGDVDAFLQQLDGAGLLARAS